MGSEKMRKEFEAFAVEFCEGLDIEEERDGDGYRRYTSDWWEFWKASRESLVIELPVIVDKEWANTQAERGAMRDAIRLCKRYIEAAGLKVKP